MKRTFALIFILLVLSPLSADSQTRKRKAPRRTAPAAQPAADSRAAAERVAKQVKTLTQFLYLLGGINKGIESVDQLAASRDASSALMAANERNKATVKESIGNVRQGLQNLESEFGTDPKLRPYAHLVTGVSDIGRLAESQASANRYDEAGRTLLRAVNHLTDALVTLR